MSLEIVAALFSADAACVEAWRAILDEHVHLRIGSREPALGQRSALAELGAFLAGVGSFGGRYREVWVLSDATLVETEIVCQAVGGRRAALVPCALVFRTGGGPKALDVRFYLDPAHVLGGGTAWPHRQVAGGREPCQPCVSNGVTDEPGRRPDEDVPSRAGLRHCPA